MKSKTNCCIICGWNKKVEAHHLKKISEYGLDDEDNIVYVCPNHHWLLDFGDDLDKEILLEKIKKISNKEPTIDKIKSKYYDSLLRYNFESEFGKMDNIEWETFKDSKNYKQAVLIISRKQYGILRDMRVSFKEEIEAKYIINKIKGFFKK